MTRTRQILCVAVNGGHDLHRAHSDSKLFQRCVCGYETEGWTVDRRDRRVAMFLLACVIIPKGMICSDRPIENVPVTLARLPSPSNAAMRPTWSEGPRVTYVWGEPGSSTWMTWPHPNLYYRPFVYRGRPTIHGARPIYGSVSATQHVGHR